MKSYELDSEKMSADYLNLFNYLIENYDLKTNRKSQNILNIFEK